MSQSCATIDKIRTISTNMDMYMNDVSLAVNKVHYANMMSKIASDRIDNDEYMEDDDERYRVFRIVNGRNFGREPAQ